MAAHRAAASASRQRSGSNGGHAAVRGVVPYGVTPSSGRSRLRCHPASRELSRDHLRVGLRPSRGARPVAHLRRHEWKRWREILASVAAVHRVHRHRRNVSADRPAASKAGATGEVEILHGCCPSARRGTHRPPRRSGSPSPAPGRRRPSARAIPSTGVGALRPPRFVLPSSRPADGGVPRATAPDAVGRSASGTGDQPHRGVVAAVVAVPDGPSRVTPTPQTSTAAAFACGSTSMLRSRSQSGGHCLARTMGGRSAVASIASFRAGELCAPA